MIWLTRMDALWDRDALRTRRLHPNTGFAAHTSVVLLTLQVVRTQLLVSREVELIILIRKTTLRRVVPVGVPCIGQLGQSSKNMLSLTCPSPSSLNHCYTTRIIQAGGAAFDHYDCGTEDWGVILLSLSPSSGLTTTEISTATVTNDVGSTVTSVQTVEQHTSRSSLTPLSISTKGAGGEAKAGDGKASATPTQSDTSQSDVGAIAGGVVGGVVGLALISCAIGFLIWRKRSQRTEAMKEVSQYGGRAY